jgi:hypothetical protein
MRKHLRRAARFLDGVRDLGKARQMLGRAKRLPGRVMRRALRPVSTHLSKSLFESLSRHHEYLSRQLLFDTVVGFVDDCRIEGDYLEFGCAQGSSLIDMFDSMRPYPRQQATRFFIFDSFEGLAWTEGRRRLSGSGWMRIHRFRPRNITSPAAP